MQNKAILCVDDETIILLSLIRELKHGFGDKYLYVKATDANQAFSAIDELAQEGVEIILIISDWLMPGIKGDEFLERVKQRNPGIKAIMITGQAEQEIIDRLLRSGCVSDVIQKPWDSSRLLEAVRKCAIEREGPP